MLQIELMMEDIQPLLVEVRDNALLKDVESLTKSLAEATEDLRYFDIYEHSDHTLNLFFRLALNSRVVVLLLLSEFI